MTSESSAPDILARQIADAVCALPPASDRRLVAIAGPPGAGKSTVTALAQQEIQTRGTPTGIISMDGFHYDNAILSARDLLHRKGAPETFDVAGFRALLARLFAEDEIAIPEFDRTLDKAIAARSVLSRDQRVILVEGNYLLLNAPGWSDLHDLWALRVFLEVPLETLEARLTARWVEHGFGPEEARARALTNDIKNARLVLESSVPGDIALK
ncbi:MAG: AAA family ATPase [Ruegeria sp.]|uniref:AAA family ATPase n=1 Tax=Ruegeria sp. TaxID=1879320 RepID=UPI00349EA80C